MRLKAFVSILIIVCLGISLCSCGADPTVGQAISLQTTDDIVCLDPQLASTKAEMTACVNLFEGLMRLDNDLTPVVAAAKSYTVSDDGLTYTFTLRDDMTWSDGETAVTADDFVYGIQRALLPQTDAPYASVLFSIKNAKAVYNGEKNISELGIKADQNKVIINLGSNDESILYYLCYPVSMPCNENFFSSTNGKYGRSKKQIISNGVFTLKSWNTDTVGEYYLRLSKNNGYNGENDAVPSSVSIGYNRVSDEIGALISSDGLDIGQILGSTLSSITNGNYKNLSYNNTSYAVYFPDKIRDIAPLLISSINRDDLDTSLPEYYSFDNTGLVPSDYLVGTQHYRENAGQITLSEYNTEKLTAAVKNNKELLERLCELKLYYPENDAHMKLCANKIVQGWQAASGATVNSAALSISELNIENKTENAVFIIPINNARSSACDTLTSLCAAVDNCNIQGSSVSQLFNTEQRLCNESAFYPLFSIADNYCVCDAIFEYTVAADGSFIEFRLTRKNDM